MAKTTKKQIMQEFDTLFDELQIKFTNELMELRRQEKITYGHYHYILNPYKNYGVVQMYGLNGRRGMALNKQNYKVWDFQYMLDSLKELEQEINEVLEQHK